METMKLPGGLNLQQMMQQAQKMQEEMAREMEALRVSASAGGGMVQIEMNGSKQVLQVKIQPEAVADIERMRPQGRPRDAEPDRQRPRRPQPARTDLTAFPCSTMLNRSAG